MANDNADLVHNTLRPSESIRAVLNAQTFNSAPKDNETGSDESRILAIITNSEKGSEEGRCMWSYAQLRGTATHIA